MKRFTVVILALALLGLAGVSMAQFDSHTVTVTASSVAKIGLSGAAPTFTLDATGAAGTDYVMPSANSATSVAYSHNKVDKKITVGCAGPGTTDIDMTVLCNSVTRTVVLAGAPQGAQDLLTGLVKGKATHGLTYEITAATLAGTGEGSYVFTVTYTLADNS